MIIAAGITNPDTSINFTAMMFAVIKQVMKMAVTMTNQGEYLCCSIAFCCESGIDVYPVIDVAVCSRIFQYNLTVLETESRKSRRSFSGQIEK